MSERLLTPEPQEADSNPDGQTKEDIRAEPEQEAAEVDKGIERATAGLRARISGLEQEILLKDEAIEALKKSLELTKEELEGAKAAYAFAVDDFKRFACGHNPVIPPEMITGSTIEEVKASLARAEELVARLKQAIQEQAPQVEIPAGAPPRTEPDVSVLSAKEKIAYAVRNRQAK